MQPGSWASMPWTYSVMIGGCSEQLDAALSDSESMSGAQAEIWPSLSVLAHCARAAVCVVMFDPFRKSPWNRHRRIQSGPLHLC